MKIKYLGLYLFPFILPLPLPLIVSSLALVLFILNLLVFDIKTIHLKNTIKNPFVLLCFAFFFLDFIRAIFKGSFDGQLFHEVRLVFAFIPLLFLNKQAILVKEFKNILKCFITGVFLYITIAWSYAIYYYNIEHPTYVFDLTDYFLIYVLSNEFPLAMHHTYIGMYIALSAVVIFVYTIHYKKISLKTGIPLVSILFVNSFFLGSKLSMLILIICMFSIIVMNSVRFSNFKKIKYVLISFIAITAFGLYSIKEWLFFTISNSFDSRINYFKRSIYVLQEHFFWGIGKDELTSTALSEAKPELGRLIPHNMFVYETLVNGIFGLVILITLLSYLTQKALKTRMLVLVLFLFLIITTGFVEDILTRQRGVFFFIFFASLLYVYAKCNQTSIKALQSSLKK